MMQKPIFTIKDLSCSYTRNKQDSVLDIKNFQISEGEVIFLLGASGSGKSTLLETLALMNNTIAGGDIVFHSPDGNIYSYADLWKNRDEEDISDIRSKNFSFIFQNTNLMDNFTAYENICISSMIKDNRTQHESLTGAYELMRKVGLPENQVSLSTLSANLSGGQRQRVAFVRALNSNFKVLFGDEPTGNLDEGNANDLMGLIKNTLRADQSVVIVSHDINLALNHATKIVCIAKDTNSITAKLSDEYVFERAYWQSLQHEEYDAFKNKIRGFYKANADHSVGDLQVRETEKSNSNTRIKFRPLFLWKEGIALSGKYYLNFLMMLAMMTLTFLAVGFANGSISYLKMKIENPFVNWLTITIPNLKSDPIEVSDVLRALNDSELKSKFDYRNVSSYKEQPFRFWSNSLNTSVVVRGRSVEMRGVGDPIMDEILTVKNHISPNARKFRDGRDLSIIVTKRFLNDLGYSVETSHVFMLASIFDTLTKSIINIKVPIQIKAIVKEIPGKVDFLYTNYFLQAYLQREGCTFDTRNKTEFWLYFEGDKLVGDKIKSLLQKFFDSNSKYSKFRPEVYLDNEPKDNTYNTGYVISIAFYPFESYKDYDMLYDDLKKDPDLKGYLKSEMLYRIYDYYNFILDNEIRLHYDYFSIIFNKPDKVRDFSTYVLNNLNDEEEKKYGNGLFEVDMGKVQEKENFLFLYNIARIVSYIVILFGSMAISLFIFNLLKMHLSKVKMNIGTFKAFGLHNHDAQFIYFTIIIVFTVLSLFCSFVLSYGIGSIVDVSLAKQLKVETGVVYYKLFDFFTLLTVVIVGCSTIIVSWFTIRRMLHKTPGDLIYNR
jgi:ABC-type lipoprotein export system ATPase subunit/ABC-type antimicrobial peptide transport system permease subunit